VGRKTHEVPTPVRALGNGVPAPAVSVGVAAVPPMVKSLTLAAPAQASLAPSRQRPTDSIPGEFGVGAKLSSWNVLELKVGFKVNQMTSTRSFVARKSAVTLLGGAAVTAKLSDALVCMLLVTVTGVAAAGSPAGTVTDSCALLAGVTAMGADVPNCTVAGATKPAPVIVTTVPEGPVAGASCARNGGTATLSDAPA
jgi:hypothetical protein